MSPRPKARGSPRPARCRASIRSGWCRGRAASGCRWRSSVARARCGRPAPSRTGNRWRATRPCSPPRPRPSPRAAPLQRLELRLDQLIGQREVADHGPPGGGSSDGEGTRVKKRRESLSSRTISASRSAAGRILSNVSSPARETPRQALCAAPPARSTHARPTRSARPATAAAPHPACASPTSVAAGLARLCQLDDHTLTDPPPPPARPSSQAPRSPRSSRLGCLSEP